jgi:hypothetical protein
VDGVEDNMGKNKKYIEKYKNLYKKMRLLINDEEIFPELSEQQFEEFVSDRDWLGVPSFSISKKEMTNSDQGHIGIYLREGILSIDLWFNGTRAVDRFLNILHYSSRNEKNKLIDELKKLSDEYKIRLMYTEKFFSAGANWETVKVIKCNDLDGSKINELFQDIKKMKEKRDIRQKEIPKSQIATIAVALAEIEMKDPSNEKLKEVLDNLAKLTRITHNLKSTSNIKKEERENKNTLELLRKRKSRMEIGIEDATQEEYDRICKRIDELEER